MRQINYTMVESHTDGFPAIKLLDEPFAGIVYTYGNVSSDEDEDTGVINLGFEYEILDKAGKEFGSMEPFEKYIGEVLQDIIHHMIAEHQTEIFEKEQNERTT